MKIGIADTTFARMDMAGKAIEVLDQNSDAAIERYTVPGFKDLPVACLRLLKDYDCDLALAFGMAGPEAIDKQCAHEASLGLQQTQLMTGKHILEVFIHADEADDEEELKGIALNRAGKHALNALALLKGKTELTENAGAGRRQGREDEGPIE